MNVLITGGGTREPIDGVRFITNFSTGATAALIADTFAQQGAQVVYLAGKGALENHAKLERIEYQTFADLDSELKALLGARSFDAVIHLAAVSDYSVASIENGGRTFRPGEVSKLDSGQELVLRLKPNFKIVDRIKGYAHGKLPLLIAFKLTKTDEPEARLAAVKKLGANPEIDFIVHNDLGDLEIGAPVFKIYRQGTPQFEFNSHDELAHGLVRIVTGKLSGERHS